MPSRPKQLPRPRAPTAATPAVRRRRVRATFDAQVDREWARYSGDAWRILVRELRDRFLVRHLSKGPGWVLELGPGPGRFTPTVLASGARVVAVDLSRPMLLALGRRQRFPSASFRLRRVRGAGEHLPFRPGAFRAAVVYGNILGFSAGGGDQLLAELARVVAPGGVLILDVSSPVAAITEFFSAAARRRFLLRILRDPEYYLFSVHTNLRDRSHQPYAPERMATWEFDFYTVAGAESALTDAGFRPIDRMAVGAIGAFRDRIAAIAHREGAAWKNLLEIEEVVGRRPGALETGHGFVMAAVRSSRRRRTRPKA